MPFLQIFTNVEEAKFPAGYFKGLHSVFMGAIKAPEKYICVNLVAGQKMSFGGTEEPAAVANITSIHNLGKEENKVITETITAELGKIGVKADRMFVVFRNIAGQDVGYDGNTFA